MAQRFKREILPATAERPQIELVRSARRTRTISMQRDGEDEYGNPAYRLFIPAASTSEEVDEHIARLLPRIQRKVTRRERAAQLTVTDEYLNERAQHLASAYLPELVSSGRLEKLAAVGVCNLCERSDSYFLHAAGGTRVRAGFGGAPRALPSTATRPFGGLPLLGETLPAPFTGPCLPGGVRTGSLAG